MKILVLAVLLLVPKGFAEVSKGVCGAQFLKIDPTPRPASMGGAFSALSDDVSAIYYNPAGLSQMDGPEGIACGAEWLCDTRFGVIAYAAPISKNRALGAGVLYLQTGEIPGYDEEGEQTEDYDAKELALSFSFAQRLSLRNHFGMTVKWISSKIEKESAYTFSVDVGEIYRPKRLKGFSFSVCVQNIGPKMKFIREEDDLPLTLRIGTAYRLMDGDAQVALDFVKLRDYDWKVCLGTEWWITKSFAIRAGYNSQIFSDLGIGITLGAELSVSTFSFCYAYIPYNELGNTHRLSFSTHFGK